MNFPLFKTLVLSGLICCVPMQAKAQDEGKSEMNVTIGIYPVEDIVTTAFRLIVDDLFDAHGGMRADNPVFFVTYKYHISERFALGGTTGYNRDSKSWDHYNDWQQRTVTSAMEATKYWTKLPGFDFYSTAGAGLFVRERTYYQSQKKTDIGTSIYFAPVGMRFGKDFGCFLEMGYGYKGILNGGLSVRF